MTSIPKGVLLPPLALTILCCVLGCEPDSLHVNAPAPMDEPFPAADPATVGLDKETLNQLSEWLADAVDANEVVGAELLVIKGRRTVLHCAYGWEDRENGIPMDTDTIFNIRSMTKPLTGAAAQLLIDEGRLALSHRVSKFLEGFDRSAAADITVEQLLTHRSGLPLSILNGVDDYPDLRTMAAAVGQSTLVSTPGSQFYYSDSGSDVLGAVVEAVSGERLDTFVTSKLLEPLGMKDSFYYTSANAADPRRERIAPLYVSLESGYSKFWAPDEPLYPFALGSQTLYSTPMDYARFLAMWVDNGTWDGTRILSSEAVERTLDPASLMTVMWGGMQSPTGFLGLEMHYGQMAVLYLDEEGEKRAIGHSGSDGTLAWAWPDRNLMILVFTQSRGSSLWLSFESNIDRLLFHPEIEQMNASVEEQFSQLLGSYVDSVGTSPQEQIEVMAFNGELAIRVPGGMLFTLEPIVSPLKWRLKLLPNQRMTFFEGMDGEIDEFNLFGDGGSRRLVRGMVQPAVDLKLEDVAHLLGTYLGVGVGREIHVVFENGALAVKIPEALTPLELLPADDDGWWTMAADPTVSIRFDSDSEGNVISFTARSPEGEAVRLKQTTAQ